MVKVIRDGRERWRFTACARLEALRIVLVCEAERGSAFCFAPTNRHCGQIRHKVKKPLIQVQQACLNLHFVVLLVTFRWHRSVATGPCPSLSPLARRRASSLASFAPPMT